MLAALGFPIAEQYHPLFGGEVDVPSYIAFQETPLQAFWPFAVVPVAIIEVFSVFSFNSPFGGGEMWSIRSDFESGDFAFDPLGLRPESPEEFKEMQTKEVRLPHHRQLIAMRARATRLCQLRSLCVRAQLNNGRLAMVGISGMVVQELVTGQKIF